MGCEVVRALVIGAGNVGRRLLGALDRAGLPARVVTRSEGWDAALDPLLRAPRIVAVREDDLPAVLARFPPPLHDRLVLVQNGFLEPVCGELDAVTRGLIWFNAKDGAFVALQPSLFHGPAAAPLATALTAGGIDAREIAEGRAFRREMILKGLWNAVVGLPLAVHDVDLSTYLAIHEDEWRALLEEGARAACAWYGVDLAAGAAADRLLATTAPLGRVRGGTKALAWRNGALVRMGRQCGVATPVNDRLLHAVGFDPEALPT